MKNNLQIKSKKQKPTMPAVKEIIVKCPKCSINMQKMSNGKYIIDKCPKCKGIFLDGNEVQNIQKISFFSYVKDYFRRNKDE